MGIFVQMELGDVLKGFHGCKCSFGIFLQLLVILAAPIHGAIPFEGASTEGGGVDFEQKGPDGLAIEEVLKTLLPAVLKEFMKTF